MKHICAIQHHACNVYHFNFKSSWRSRIVLFYDSAFGNVSLKMVGIPL